MGSGRILAYGAATSLVLLFLAHALELHLYLSPDHLELFHDIKATIQAQLLGNHHVAHVVTDAETLSYSELIQSYQGSRKPFTRHIVAVGDLHGDLPNARKVLRFSGVVDEDFNWSGDVDFFVQTGDIIDRYVSFHVVQTIAEKC
jgi:Calcineurin-like phosphoesterase